jgi:DNA-binding NtrC family response regulator
MENQYNLKILEEGLIKDAMKAFDNNKLKAANALGISLKTLYNKIEVYGLSTSFNRPKSKSKEIVNDENRA